MVNTHKQVYVERLGKLEATPALQGRTPFDARDQKIVSAVDRRRWIHQVDARLTDGNRGQRAGAAAVDDPLVSIRKFSRCRSTYQD
jgi:pilus assembly protein CpaF